MLRIKSPLLKVWLVLFVVSSCAKPGPSVTGCVVDAAAKGFQCTAHGKSFYLTFDAGRALNCYAPSDIELYIKACAQHRIIEITSCKFQDMDFLCGNLYKSALDVDNYFCLSDKDKRRIDERCTY